MPVYPGARQKVAKDRTCLSVRKQRRQLDLKITQFRAKSLRKQLRQGRNGAAHPATTTTVEPRSIHAELPEHCIELPHSIVFKIPMTTACWARLLCFTISAKLLIDHDLFQPAEDALAFNKFQTDIGCRLASFQIYCRNTRTGN
jgi:hypothetical protein